MANSGTAVLLIDVYNDFLHSNGKLNFKLVESMADTDTVTHLHELIAAARQSKIPIFYGLHQQTHEHSFQGWQMMNRSMKGLGKNMVFEEGSWGADFFEGLAPDPSNGDVVVSKHWNSSSFQNTDLDYQLQQRGIKRVVLAGLTANTCLESSARYAYEFGYKVTMLTDATAGFSTEMKDAATKLIWPLFADDVVTVNEWSQSLQIQQSL